MFIDKDYYLEEPYLACLIYCEGMWYYYDAEFIEDSAVGPFNNGTEAVLHATYYGYNMIEVDHEWSD